MTVHEFGKENEQVIVLVHPSIVMWDYFEYVYLLMEKKYHLIIPAIPGYDPDEKSDFTRVEEISAELEDWLITKNLNNVACLYGCSMGGSIVMRMLADNNSNCRHIEYWVAEKEMKDRTADVAYIKRVFPHTILRKVKNMGHGGLAPFNPELFVRGIERAIKEEKRNGTV